MSLLVDLESRGLLQEVTHRDELGKLLHSESITLYAGYDPTGPSLHVGSLVPTILLRRFQLAGHRPIVLVGGATGMIGDPSGKSDERRLLDADTLAANVAGIRGQLARLLDFEDPTTGAILTNNFDWMRGMTYLEFLRDVGKCLTVNYMLAKDAVRTRLEAESGISYTEFSYMLLQAYDFVHLSRTHGCRLQIGGSDQYGNITAGVELGHRVGRPQLFGLVAPLLLDSTGVKMGKTASGEAIWLDPARTRPYDFYQYWFNVADADAPRFLRMFSLRPLGELEELLKAHDADRSQRLAQRELASTVTRWIHGDAAVLGIEAANRVMFGGVSIRDLSRPELDALAATLPCLELPRTELAAGIPLLDLLTRTLVESKGEARRLISQGGAYVNDVQIKDATRQVTLDDLITDALLVLRSGKRTYHLIRAT